MLLLSKQLQITRSVIPRYAIFVMYMVVAGGEHLVWICSICDCHELMNKEVCVAVFFLIGVPYFTPLGIRPKGWANL